MPTNRLVVKEQIATYTQLLFEAVKNDGGQDGVLAVRDQLITIVAALRGNADLDSALKDPGFTPEQKANLVRGVFAEANPALVSVLALMAERGEVDYLPRVSEGFEKKMSEELGLVVVDVTTAVELDDHLRELIKQKAEAGLGKSVVLEEHIDKSMIGGIIMSTADERIDASILSQIEKTRTVLKQ